MDPLDQKWNNSQTWFFREHLQGPRHNGEKQWFQPVSVAILSLNRNTTGSFAGQPMRRAAGWENARAGALRGTQRGWSTGIRA